MSNLIYLSNDVIGLLCTFPQRRHTKTRKVGYFYPRKMPPETASLPFSLKPHKLTSFINFFALYLLDKCSTKYLFSFLL